MRDDVWETIDWGDDIENDSQALAAFDRKDTTATARLSGSSASGECDKPSDPPTTITFSERKQHAGKKSSSWFDADLTKLVPLENETGRYRSSDRSQCKVSSPRVEDEPPRRRIGRRQSDYALEKRRVLEKHTSLEERPVASRSLTKRLLSSVGLRKNSEVSDSSDDDLDVPFPTNIRRRSCY